MGSNRIVWERWSKDPRETEKAKCSAVCAHMLLERSECGTKSVWLVVPEQQQVPRYIWIWIRIRNTSRSCGWSATSAPETSRVHRRPRDKSKLGRQFYQIKGGSHETERNKLIKAEIKLQLHWLPRVLAGKSESDHEQVTECCSKALSCCDAGESNGIASDWRDSRVGRPQGDALTLRGGNSVVNPIRLTSVR